MGALDTGLEKQDQVVTALGAINNNGAAASSFVRSTLHGGVQHIAEGALKVMESISSCVGIISVCVESEIDYIM